MIEITKENFKSEVLESKEPVIVKFWAPWCGHCIALDKTIEEILDSRKSEKKDENGEKVKFCKLNIDDSPEIAAEYAVMTIPCTIRFENGVEVNRTVGNLPKDAFRNSLGI